jgi:hypothetical protein
MASDFVPYGTVNLCLLFAIYSNYQHIWVDKNNNFRKLAIAGTRHFLHFLFLIPNGYNNYFFAKPMGI